MPDTLVEVIAGFAHRLNYGDLPREVVDKCKTVILHGIGVGLSGFNTEIGQIGIEVAKEFFGGGRGEATILVDGSKVSPAAAAFANSAMFHSLAQEDTYMPGLLHSGVCVIPAALAMGEVKKRSGKELITAVALGYEVGARASENFCWLNVKRGFRATTVYGPMIAALAAAKLLALDENQMRNALGWGANLAFGVTQWATAKSYEMPLQNGFVASNGITAAYLGQHGAVTAGEILEGEHGLYNGFAGTRENLGQIVDGLGKGYKMLATSLKRSVAGGHSQTPAMAIVQLVREVEIDPNEVERVELRLNPEQSSYPGYKTMNPGVINARYLTAIAILKRKLSAATLSLDNSPRVLDLMSKVQVISDDKRPLETCKYTVILKNGRTLNKELDMSGDKWLFSLDEETDWQKKELIPEMAIEPAKANKMISLVRDLENCKDVSEITKTVVSPGRKSPRYRIVF